MNYLSSPASEVCFACENGFFTQNSICVPVPACPTGQFAALQPSGYANFTSFCAKCPYGCDKCTVPDISKPFTDIKCLECNAAKF